MIKKISDNEIIENDIDLKKNTLAIACVIANEKDSINRFITEMLSACKEFGSVQFIAVFDKTDTDGTRALVELMAKSDPRISLVYAPQCNNVVDAILIAYQEAVNTGFDWILEINAGFRHQPDDLRKFLPYLLEGYGCIFGSRFMQNGSMNAPSILRYIYSKGGTWITNLLLGTSLTDMTSGYQIVTNQIAKDILAKNIKSKYHFINTEMKVYCRNYKTIEVPITYITKASNLKLAALIDAFQNLIRLFILRLIGKL